MPDQQFTDSPAPTFKDSSVFENLAVALSSLCVLHCLAMPFIIILLPAISHLFTETIEWIIIGSVIPVGLAGFLPVWIRHKNKPLLYRFIIGLGVLMITQIIMHVWGSHESWPWVAFSAIGSMSGAILMAVAIYKNRRHTHVCKNPHHVHKE